jgi:hypothetical protein
MNKNFVIYNVQGQILRTGYCPEEAFDLQAKENELIIEATACCSKDSVNPQTGEIIEGCNPSLSGGPVLSGEPISTRLSTESQLDLLWQAMDAGTFPKAEPFYSAIKAQKEAAL